MNQIADILKLADEAVQCGIDAVLATVVRTEGSAYRRAGAMMLICADGRSAGMISGGCLEPHIIKRAFWLTRNGATVQVYQTGDDIEYTANGKAKQATLSDDKHESDFLDIHVYNDDLDKDSYHKMDELNFGLGCNGRVHVLFERLMTATPLLTVINQVRKTQQPKMIATLIRTDGSYDTQMQVGMRINLDDYIQSGQIAPFAATDTNSINTNSIDVNNSANQVNSDKLSTLLNTVKKLAQYKLDDKDTEYVVVKEDSGAKEDNNDNDNANVVTQWLVQRLEPQTRLLICGAGNDVMPLVTMAKLQDWHVTIIDSRAQYATRRRFPQADEVMPLALDDTDILLKLSHNAAVALMSHSLSQDRARLKVLLTHANHYRYLGQLGPRYRTERLISEISATVTDSKALATGIRQLYYPIGYKLGGDGPEALALGIMAQIQAVMHHQIPPAKDVELDSNDTALMSYV